MAVSEDQIAFVHEVFAEVPGLGTRKMFGGLGIYSEGQIFAMIGPEGALLIKARGEMLEDLQALGSTQFDGTSVTGKKGNMPYWSLPESAMDDPEEAADWARRALALS